MIASLLASLALVAQPQEQASETPSSIVAPPPPVPVPAPISPPAPVQVIQINGEEYGADLPLDYCTINPTPAPIQQMIRLDQENPLRGQMVKYGYYCGPEMRPVSDENGYFIRQYPHLGNGFASREAFLANAATKSQEPGFTAALNDPARTAKARDFAKSVSGEEIDMNVRDMPLSTDDVCSYTRLWISDPGASEPLIWGIACYSWIDGIIIKVDFFSGRRLNLSEGELARRARKVMASLFKVPE